MCSASCHVYHVHQKHGAARPGPMNYLSYVLSPLKPTLFSSGHLSNHLQSIITAILLLLLLLISVRKSYPELPWATACRVGQSLCCSPSPRNLLVSYWKDATAKGASLRKQFQVVSPVFCCCFYHSMLCMRGSDEVGTKPESTAGPAAVHQCILLLTYSVLHSAL